MHSTRYPWLVIALLAGLMVLPACGAAGGDGSDDDDGGVTPDAIDTDTLDPTDTVAGDGAADVADEATEPDTDVVAGDVAADGDGDTAGHLDVPPIEDIPPTDMIDPGDGTATGPSGFPGSELVLKLVTPSGGKTASSIGSQVTLGGVLFGDADTIEWATESGDTGFIQPGAFWGSGPVTLAIGDNTITVTAKSEDATSTDTIVVTYNPAFKFDDDLLARPNVVWNGSTQSVVFTVPVSLYPNFQANTVTLLEVDGDGQTVSTLSQMVDNGSVGSTGDEIDGDGVFSTKQSVTCSSDQPKYYRVSVEVNQGATSYTAYSSVIPIWCTQHLTSSSCSSHQQIVVQAEQAVLGGATVEEVITGLQANNTVTAAGRAEGEGHSIWVQFDTGVLGAVLLAPPGIRGSGGQGFDPPGEPSLYEPAAVTHGNVVDIGSKKAIVLAPFAQEFAGSDDGPEVASILATSECPSFTVEGGTALQGGASNLDRMRNLSAYGVVSISTHGDALFGDIDPAVSASLYGWEHTGSQEVLWTGEAVQCSQLLQTNKSCTISGTNPTGGCPVGTTCEITQGSGGGSASGVCLDRTQVDLRRGNVVITNKGYAVTPSFFEAYSGRGFPNTLFNLGACRSMYNGTLAAALFSRGGQAITGFSDYVTSEWAKEKVIELFSGSVGTGLIGQFHAGGEDPSMPGSKWTLFGAGNLSLSNADIINAGFETGDTTGWTRDGDGRVISQLGGTIPVGGKFMGLLSTGLGFTVQTGTLEQDFCIPADKTEIQIYWKFFSEEFKEYCGSQFQDTFQAVLTGDGGQLTIVDVKIDDLCGYEDGSCSNCNAPIACDYGCMGGSGCTYDANSGTCTGSYPCECGKYFIGLTPSDIGFDQGGVYNILWRKTVKNVKALVGKGKVNLRLYASDAGDSIFDTVILIDSIEFH